MLIINSAEVQSAKTGKFNDCRAETVYTCSQCNFTASNGFSEFVLDAEGRLNTRIEQLQAEGKTRDEAVNTALEELATELGTTREAITLQLTDFQTELNADLSKLATKEQVAAVEANILDSIEAYEAQGYSRDVAIQKIYKPALSGEYMNIEVMILGSSGFLAFLLVIMLIIWAFKPNGKKKNVRKDLKNIKDQINGNS